MFLKVFIIKIFNKIKHKLEPYRNKFHDISRVTISLQGKYVKTK